MATVESMPTVERISESRIRRVLDRLGASHRIDKDGDIVGVLSADEDCPYEVLWYIELTGEDKRVLSIAMIGGRDVPERDQGRALLACNKWNNDRRLPKAFLHVGSETRIMAQETIFLEAGIHDELLSEFIATVLTVGWQMFSTISKEGL